LAGKFRIERRVGAGGMGVVYAGRDLALGRAVALKTLSTLTAPAAERLGQEARMMAAVGHPNLATIFGLERWRSTPILIVEFLEGDTLAARMANGPLPVQPVLGMGVLLAGALDRLHNAGVLHRDVKPGNIAFSAGDVPKLLDFGLARFMSADPVRAMASATGETAPSQTRTVHVAGGVVAGTPLYLPPEAVAGREPDASWDLWALSLVLYEAIAGRHPFTAPTVEEVLANIARTRVPDIRRLRPDCPDAVAKTFLSLLSPDSKHRPGCARALRDRLQQLAG
jgi:serine/threonine-protein kinase